MVRIALSVFSCIITNLRITKSFYIVLETGNIRTYSEPITKSISFDTYCNYKTCQLNCQNYKQKSLD